MTLRIVERFRASPTLVGHALVGAAAPWMIVIGESRAGGDGFGVGSAIVAAIIAAVALSFYCRRFSVHLLGAAVAWMGWTLSGAVLICLLFSGFAAPDLWGSVLIAGWIGLWTALPCALVINGATALIMHYARPRLGSSARCGRCDYDLRGLPHNRCPECGTVNERSSSA